MISHFREYFDEKTVGTLSIAGATLLGVGIYATVGATVGWKLGFPIGSREWFATLIAWPALPIVVLGLLFGVFGRGPFGHDLGDWNGERYDY